MGPLPYLSPACSSPRPISSPCPVNLYGLVWPCIFFLRPRRPRLVTATRSSRDQGSPGPGEILRLDFNTSASLISRATRLLFRQHQRRLITTGVQLKHARVGKGGWEGLARAARVLHARRYLPDVTHSVSRDQHAHPPRIRLVSAAISATYTAAGRPVLFQVGSPPDLAEDSVMRLCLVGARCRVLKNLRV